MKVRAIEVFPCCTLVKGPQSPGESRMVLACSAFGVGRAMDAWEPFHFHSTASYGVYPPADCAISLSNSPICIPVIAEQGSFLHYKNLPLLRLIQRCSGNLALSPPLPLLPQSAFLSPKAACCVFLSPQQMDLDDCMCSGLLPLPAILAGKAPACGREQSPRIPEVSIDAEGTERSVKEMTEAQQDPPPSLPLPHPPIQGAGAGL